MVRILKKKTINITFMEFRDQSRKTEYKALKWLDLNLWARMAWIQKHGQNVIFAY